MTLRECLLWVESGHCAATAEREYERHEKVVGSWAGRDLFVGGLAWKLIDVTDCADEGGVIVAPLTAHQECARR